MNAEFFYCLSLGRLALFRALAFHWAANQGDTPATRRMHNYWRKNIKFWLWLYFVEAVKARLSGLPW
jgi:hypothetical protein